MPGSSSHPYYPLAADIVGYSPNQTSVLDLLVSAGGGCALLLGLTFAVASYVRPTLRMVDRIAILWFVLCMTFHLGDYPEDGLTDCSRDTSLFLRGLFHDPS